MVAKPTGNCYAPNNMETNVAKLNEALRLAGASGAEIAKRAGVAPMSMSRYLRGKSPMPEAVREVCLQVIRETATAAVKNGRTALAELAAAQTEWTGGVTG